MKTPVCTLVCRERNPVFIRLTRLSQIIFERVAEVIRVNKVGAGVVRRIDVDQFEPASKIFEEGRQHKLVISPDQPVSEIVPVLPLLVKQRALCFGARAWLINCFDLLKRHCDDERGFAKSTSISKKILDGTLSSNG